MGESRIGCMDRSASNYSSTAVLDDGTCIYNFGLINAIFENNPTDKSISSACKVKLDD